MPQQQRKAGWLALPAQKGGGDRWPRGAELCADMSFTPPPLPSPLDVLFDTQCVGEQGSRKVEGKKKEKGNLQGYNFSVSLDTKKRPKFCTWWQLKHDCHALETT